MKSDTDPNCPQNRVAPWNRGKLTGQKPPLQPKHMWAIRSRLQLTRCARDLALFNLAIDSKLRGCDVVSLKVEDVAPHGYTVDRATVRQKNTGRSGSKSNTPEVQIDHLPGHQTGVAGPAIFRAKDFHGHLRGVRICHDPPFIQIFAGFFDFDVTDK